MPAVIRLMTAIPKSGSSFLGDCAALMASKDVGAEKAARMYPFWWYDTGGTDWDLRPEIMKMERATPLPEGAPDPGMLYKGHFWANGKNLAVLDMYGDIKYIVLIRAPKDQLAAEFCSCLYKPAENKYNPIYPLNTDMCFANDIVPGLEYLICGGYLDHALLWVNDWLKVVAGRHNGRATVITYEELLNNPMKTLKSVQELFGFDLSDDNLRDIYNNTSAYHTNKEINPAHYPKGWTGETGIWKKYFTRPLKKAFNRRFKALVADGFDLLSEIYPNGEYK